MNHTHPPIDHSSVTDLILIGTNTCCQSHFDESLLAKGVRVDISLEEEHVDMPYGVDFYVWLPTKDHTPPSPEKLAFGVQSLTFFIDHKLPCYVHCKNGHGRAPTLVAAYLIACQNMTVDEAIRFVQGKRSGTHIEPNQREALVEFQSSSSKLASRNVSNSPVMF